MTVKRVVLGLLGVNLDGGKTPTRWEAWRPSVAICQHEDLLVHRFELLHSGSRLPGRDRPRGPDRGVARDWEAVDHFKTPNGAKACSIRSAARSGPSVTATEILSRLPPPRSRFGVLVELGPASAPRVAEAGRKLFAVSRQKKKVANDADRIRKYLASHGLEWGQVRGE
jgi:sigma54-dependent transcription regulator